MIRCLGILLCRLSAAEQAKLRKHPFSQELSLLLVHGLLHLLGYDHIEDDDAEIMEALERSCLRKLMDWPHQFGYRKAH